MKQSTLEKTAPRGAKKETKIELGVSQKEIAKLMKLPGNPVSELIKEAIGKNTPFAWLRTVAKLEANEWRVNGFDLARARETSPRAIRNHVNQFNSIVGEQLGVYLVIDANGTVMTSDQDVVGQMRDNELIERARPALERTKRRLASAQVRGTVNTLPFPEGSTAAQLILSFGSAQKQLAGGK